MLVGTIRNATTNVLEGFSYTGTDWTFTTIDTASGDIMFSQDFSKYDGTTSPHQYTLADSLVDFQQRVIGYDDEWNIETPLIHIVDDPSANPTRGKVFRITQPGGNVNLSSVEAVNIAIDFGGGNPYDNSGPQEAYFAFDMFLPENYVILSYLKTHGMFTGTRLEASHLDETPVPEGVKAFLNKIQIFGPGSYHFPSYTSALADYFYDANIVQFNDFWSTTDPTSGIYPMPNATTQPEDIDPYQLTLGSWVTIEMYTKINTSGANGEMRVWVTDPTRWTGAKMVLEDTGRTWKDDSAQMSVDRVWLHNNPGWEQNANLDVTQYHYYDNFRISKSPITHT